MWSLRKIQAFDGDFLLALQIRTAVFVQEQGVDNSDEYTTNGIKLERFAVLKAHRGEGIGKYLVEQVIEEVQKHAKPIYLDQPCQFCLEVKAMEF